MSIKGRLLTSVRFRYGPLSRRIDRIEARSRIALLLIFLIVSLPAVWFVGGAVSRASAERERVQQSERWSVSARLLENAPATDARTPAIRMPSTAEWTQPDGSRHTGIVWVTPGSRAGSIHTVWTDASGNPVSEPVSHHDTVAAVVAAVFLVMVNTIRNTGSLGGTAGHSIDTALLPLETATATHPPP
jgi:hypothetical protein